MKILILSALPREYLPLKRLFPAFRVVRSAPYGKFSLDLPGKEIILVETGMGPGAVEKVAREELKAQAPDLMLFSGFAGGLHPDLSIGSVCVVTSTRHVEAEKRVIFHFSEEMVRFLYKNQVKPVLALTAKAPENKRRLWALVRGEPAVLDMETAWVAEAARSREIPFICFRAISDPVDRELGFDLQDICDENWEVRPLRVLKTVVKRPPTMWAFYRLWRGSSLAAKNLCLFVASFLELPSEEFGRMAAEIKLERK